LAQAQREAEWRKAEAEAKSTALEARATATVKSLQADVGLLQQELTALVEHAMALLPALDRAAAQLASGSAGEVEAGGAAGAVEVGAGAGAAAVEVGAAPPQEVWPGRGLGQLTSRGEEFGDGQPAGDGVSEDEVGRPAATLRRRPLGRLLGRR
jgi:hypothetical protein